MTLATIAGCGEQAADKVQHRTPTVAEAEQVVQQIAPVVDRTGANVRVVNLPGGAQQIDLNGGFQNALVARTNADGTVSTACVDSTEQARQFLLAAPAASQRAVR
jgi:hypothetical protein